MKLAKGLANRLIKEGGVETPESKRTASGLEDLANRIEGQAAINARRNFIRLMVIAAMVEGNPITSPSIIQARLARDMNTEVEEKTIMSDLSYLGIQRAQLVNEKGVASGELFYLALPPSADPGRLSSWSSDVIAIETDARLMSHLVHAFPFQDKVFLTCENNTAPMVKDMLVLNPWPEMLSAVCDHDTIIIFCPTEEAAMILHHKIMHTYDETPRFRVFKASVVLPQQDYRAFYRHIEDAYKQRMEGLRGGDVNPFVKPEDILIVDPYAEELGVADPAPSLSQPPLDSQGSDEDSDD